MVNNEPSDSFDKIIDDVDEFLKYKDHGDSGLYKKRKYSQYKPLKKWGWLVIVIIIGILLVLSKTGIDNNFQFDYVSIGEIRNKMMSPQGYYRDDFVKDYGKPSSMSYSNGSLLYDGGEKFVDLYTDKKANQRGKLSILYYSKIKDPAANKVSYFFARTLTNNELDDLTVGKSMLDDSGISYSDFIKKFGVPKSVSTHGQINTQHKEELYSLSCVYPYEKGRTVLLSFHKKSYSGQYHLVDSFYIRDSAGKPLYIKKVR